MFIALFAILFLGGGTTGMLDYIADSRDEVKTLVEEKDRRKEALASLSDMKKRTKTYNKMLKGETAELSDLLGDEEASGADIDAVLDSYRAERVEYDNDMLDLRFQLKDQLTREEWEQVFREE